MFDTRTSPAFALAAIRAAMWTAIPPMSSPRRTHSPVCSPLRMSRPICGMRSASAVAHRTARVGPSNVASTPSPVSLTNRPWKEAISARVISSWRCQQLAPTLIAEFGGASGGIDDVGEQHRGQHSVRRVLVSLSGQELLHLAGDRLESPTCGTWSTPSSSTSRAPGIVAASSRPISIGIASCLRCNTSVGTPTLLAMCRKSGCRVKCLPGEKGHLRTHGGALESADPLSGRGVVTQSRRGPVDSLPLAPMVDRPPKSHQGLGNSGLHGQIG